MLHCTSEMEDNLEYPSGELSGSVSRFAIVVVAYNRAKALRRLLQVLEKAEYGSDFVDVVVSIDYSGSQRELVDIAELWVWQHGRKIVRAFETRQGLRAHVLACGDLAYGYDAVIVLEDDLYVSRQFYRFAREAVTFYGNDPCVAGLSLYAPNMNEMVERPFIPLRNGYDVYALQSAQSWGQCWTRKMWDGFRQWYKNNTGRLERAFDLPEKIYRWPETSWKKYFMKYLVVSGRTFVYPYDSLTTNSSAVGQHHLEPSSAYEVPVLEGRKHFQFGPVHNLVAYDSFFERVGLTWVGKDGTQGTVCADLYGSKRMSDGSRYLLTRKQLGYKVIAAYGLHLRPHEYNFEAEEDGNDIWLFDLSSDVRNIEGASDIGRELNYHITVPWKLTLIHGCIGCTKYVFRKVTSLFRRFI